MVLKTMVWRSCGHHNSSDQGLLLQRNLQNRIPFRLRKMSDSVCFRPAPVPFWARPMFGTIRFGVCSDAARSGFANARLRKRVAQRWLPSTGCANRMSLGVESVLSGIVGNPTILSGPSFFNNLPVRESRQHPCWTRSEKKWWG